LALRVRELVFRAPVISAVNRDSVVKGMGVPRPPGVMLLAQPALTEAR
jgi:hypothetical protein